MGRLSWIVWVGPKCNHMCPYKRESERTLTRQYDQGSRDWSDAATIQGMLAATRSWKRKGLDSPPRASRGSMALLTPWFQPRETDFGLLTYRTVKNVFFKKIFIYLAVLGVSCGMQDLVPWPGIEPGSPALGAWSLNHWATREVPQMCIVLSHQVCGNLLQQP